MSTQTAQVPVAASQAQAPSLKSFNQTINSDRMQQYLVQVLAERKASFVNNIVAMVGGNTALQKCEPLTIIYAGMKATALGLPLDPNLGQAYVIPYGNKAQFQIGYKGFIQLAIRSGQFKTLNVTEIKEGEIEDLDLLTGAMKFKAKGNRHELPIAGYAAYFELTNGFAKSLYMTEAEVIAHAQRHSKSFSSGPWKTDFDTMAKKTVLKLLLNRFAPLSVEMVQAVQADQAVFSKGENTPEYVDSPFANMAEEARFEEMPAEDGVDLDTAKAILLATSTTEELENAWNTLSQAQRQDRELMAVVKEHRLSLTQQSPDNDELQFAN